MSLIHLILSFHKRVRSITSFGIIIYILTRFGKSVLLLFQTPTRPSPTSLNMGLWVSKNGIFGEGVGDIDIAVYSDCLYLFLSYTK